MKVFLFSIVVTLIAISCESKHTVAQVEGGTDDSVCMKTAEFLKGVIDNQQRQIDSLQDELNKLSTVQR
jgi:hypothetical protein